MKLEEALRSGKRFRRRNEGWCEAHSGRRYDRSDVLAGDWEVEREPREWSIMFDVKTGAMVSPAMCRCMLLHPEGPFDMIKVREVLE